MLFLEWQSWVELSGRDDGYDSRSSKILTLSAVDRMLRTIDHLLSSLLHEAAWLSHINDPGSIPM